jgi:drug/metabolite transporter (DMT)-like permease
MGELAALGTAFCWAFSSIFFTSSSKEAGAIPVNRIRLVFAVLLLLVFHTLITGHPLPLDAEPFRWLWLGLSGIVGLVIGDTLLFQAYYLIGNRLGTLIMSGVPVISSLAAWLFLGEKLSLINIAGIALCTGGIMVVVMERKPGNGGETQTHHERRQYILGVLYAIGGAIGQAGGLVLAKKGLADNFPSISGVIIRMLTAMIFMWVLTLLMGQIKQTLQKVYNNSKLIIQIASGTVIGPFLGVWLSQIAVQRSYVGIASTLMALTPIVVLPISKFYYREKISVTAVIGTVIALVGVGVIFL